MIEKKRLGLIILFCLLAVISIAGCDTKKGPKDGINTDFVKSSDGLVMEFVKNYPGDRYLVSGNPADPHEPISIYVDIRNKGTYPDSGANPFGNGKIFISGFDDNIIEFPNGKSKPISNLYLSGVSQINPLGGLDTVEFSGNIIQDKLTADSYDPTIIATVCYPYITKAGPSVCVDPFPFDDRQQKVCKIGSQTLSSQGAPIAVTRVDQEAATNNIKFKISIKNVGKGDVLKPGNVVIDKCSLSNGKLDRRDFDIIKVNKIQIGSVDLFSSRKCGPFADGTTDMVKLVNGEGFIICSLTVSDLGNAQSAYTTPLNIELGYSYRSMISKPIKVSKLTTVS